MRVFGDPREWPDADLIGFSDEYSAEAVVAAYTEGVFPMPLYWGGFEGQIGWWSPVERGVFPDAEVHISRSLARSARRYRCTVDAAFNQVLAGCADPKRPHGWIDGRIKQVYRELFEHGLVHSVEVWDERDRLAGGLYGVSLGGLFCGESMFHAPGSRDASKVALVHLSEVLQASGDDVVLDVQWVTDHLASLGAIAIEREEYLEAIEEVLELPGPNWASLTAVGAHA